MKKFIFTIDDNIRFFEDLSKNNYKSIFENPYLAMIKRLHDKYGILPQLNLFFKSKTFDLSQMTDRYKKEFEQNSNWLKFSFHSFFEEPRPYEFVGYQQVFEDCKKTNEQIIRFAGKSSLAKTTTIHYCLTTDDGVKALKDCGVKALLGLYGDDNSPRMSYCCNDIVSGKIRRGEMVLDRGVVFAGIDQVINGIYFEDIEKCMQPLLEREFVKVMIHEQYFYSDYKNYQPDFEQKLSLVFKILVDNGYKSCFFEDVI